ncbi:uncharacterized protein LOC134607702 [Pelobates fuscus]|uniref:uncharacterized protein LOC134607702 n=1 Tax=Pelobates fuscus TaxID=191477 RepID=UPI002FE44716
MSCKVLGFTPDCHCWIMSLMARLHVASVFLLLTFVIVQTSTTSEILISVLTRGPATNTEIPVGTAQSILLGTPDIIVSETVIIGDSTIKPTTINTTKTQCIMTPEHTPSPITNPEKSIVSANRKNTKKINVQMATTKITTTVSKKGYLKSSTTTRSTMVSTVITKDSRPPLRYTNNTTASSSIPKSAPCNTTVGTSTNATTTTSSTASYITSTLAPAKTTTTITMNFKLTGIPRFAAKKLLQEVCSLLKFAPSNISGVMVTLFQKKKISLNCTKY